MNRYHEEDKAMSKKNAAEFGEGCMPPVPTISIERPVAFPGDRVMVDNYRKKIDTIESAIVVDLETTWRSKTEVIHAYRVKLDRKTKHGDSMYLVVGDNQII